MADKEKYNVYVFREDMRFITVHEREVAVSWEDQLRKEGGKIRVGAEFFGKIKNKCEMWNAVCNKKQ